MASSDVRELAQQQVQLVLMLGGKACEQFLALRPQVDLDDALVASSGAPNSLAGAQEAAQAVPEEGQALEVVLAKSRARGTERR